MQLITIVEDYVYALMRQAQAEVLEDGAVVATVTDAPGVVASGSDVHECSADLYVRLEDWVKVRIQRGYHLPAVGAINPNCPEWRALAQYRDGELKPFPEHYYANEEELEAAFAARPKPN